MSITVINMCAIEEQQRRDFQWFIAQLPPCLSKIIISHAKRILEDAEMEQLVEDFRNKILTRQIEQYYAIADPMLSASNALRRRLRLVRFPSSPRFDKWSHTNNNIERCDQHPHSKFQRHNKYSHANLCTNKRAKKLKHIKYNRFWRPQPHES